MNWKKILPVALVLFVVLVVTFIAILSTYDFNEFKPVVVRTVKEATGRDLTLGGDIDLKIGLAPSLVIDDVRFQNSRWGSRPELAKVKHLEVQVALFPLIGGNIEIRRFILVEPDILVETDKSGRSNLEFKGAKKPGEGEVGEEDELLPLDFKHIRIEKGRFAYKDGKSGKTYFVAVESLKAAARRVDSPLKLQLKGAYKDHAFEIGGTLGRLHLMTDPDKAWPLHLKAKAASTIVTAKGTVRDVMAAKGIDITLRVEGRKLPEMVGLVQVNDLPDVGPFRIDFKISDPAPKTYKISELKVAFRDSDVGGSAQISLAGKRPNLRATLSSKNLDLRPLLSGGGSKVESKKPADQPVKQPDKVFPNNPLPLENLKKADVEVEFEAGRIMLPRLALSELSFEMQIKDGLLLLNPVRSVIGGGKMNGRFELRPKGISATMATALKIEHLDLGQMLGELGLGTSVDGDIDLDLELNSDGKSVAGLMGSLNGKTIIVMSNGRIENKYVDLLGADLSSSIFHLINPSKDKKKHAEISCSVAHFEMKDGIAEIDALVLDLGSMIVVGDGKINLKTEELDVSLNPSPKKGVGLPGIGRLSASLGELTQPFKLGGTLARPALAIDPTQTAISLGKAIGGITLFGPFGVAAVLAEGSLGGGNPCLKAIQAAKKADKASDGKKATGQ
jgi:uncharacterized protein involved in outer membrane biogenesis